MDEWAEVTEDQRMKELGSISQVYIHVTLGITWEITYFSSPKQATYSFRFHPELAWMHVTHWIMTHAAIHTAKLTQLNWWEILKLQK